MEWKLEQRQKNAMEQEKLLKDYSVEERTAYLKAITALATAGRTATDDENYLLEAIAESAELPENDVEAIRSTAGAPSTDEELKQSLDILKNSDLRFSLLTDLTAFAESDQSVTAEEKQQLRSVAAYLNIDEQQVSTIHQFVNKAATTEVSQEAAAQPQSFLESLGMGNQFSKAGMNFGKISKGLLGMLAPFLLGKMMGRRSGSGGLGGMLGGLLGGGSGGFGGGFGSLISMLNGGRGMGNMGGMLGRMFGR
jgi:uncharacterized tellurite resistance protein B-like protein